jgi:hypothetical protein
MHYQERVRIGRLASDGPHANDGERQICNRARPQ